jgi:hypothetical protein
MKQQWLDFIEAWEDVKPIVEDMVKNPAYSIEAVSMCKDEQLETVRSAWLENYNLLQSILGVYNSNGTDNTYISDYLANIKYLADCILNANEYVVITADKIEDVAESDTCWGSLNNLYRSVKDGYVTSLNKIEDMLHTCIDELGNQIKGDYGSEFYSKVFPFITIWGNTVFALTRYMNEDKKSKLSVVKRGVDAYIKMDMRVTENKEDNVEKKSEQQSFNWDSDEETIKKCEELAKECDGNDESKERSECVWRICRSVTNKLKRGEYVSPGEFLLAFQMITADFEIDVRKKFKDWKEAHKYYKILNFVHSYFKNLSNNEGEYEE